MVQARDEIISHSDIPQALKLLDEMNVSAQHVATLVDNMIQRVRKGEISTNQGLGFLEMKYNMLLSYLINLTYIVLRKCSGEKIEDDPCIDRLVEIRTVLERIRPIDHKLKYQIDKLVKTAITGTSANDPSTFRANPGNLMGNVDENSESESDNDGVTTKDRSRSGIYIPPKLSAVHFTDESAKERNKRTQEKNKQLALSSSIMQDLREEYLDIPLEISQGSKAQQMLSKHQQEQQAYEEEYLTRLPLSKAERHARKHITTVSTLGNEVTSFSDTRGKNKRKLYKSKGKNNKRKRLH